AWTPTTSWGQSQATCDYNCNTNYTWNGSSCMPIVNCSYVTYQGGSCSASCGGGNYATYYTKTVVESGGGTCPIFEGQFAGYSGGSCNTTSCAVNCSYVTYQGGSCSASCGGGNYDTYYTKTVVESGGGTCPISEGQFAGYNGGSCNASACCTPNGSCSAAAPACGSTTYGADNCGNSCSLNGPVCCVSNIGDSCMKSGTINTTWYCGDINVAFNDGTYDLCSWNGYCGSTVLNMGAWDLSGNGCTARANLASECNGSKSCSYSGLVPGTISCDGSCY
ncbi:hypothetical protein K2X92_04405, partial [Candidatus Gracilibacteria bacterium]|nr:hypothetical protein [Candidatus Gracilibacteria bacterium]